MRPRPVREDYLDAAEAVVTPNHNPYHIEKVLLFAQHHRMVDYHVDYAAWLDDQGELENPRAEKKRLQEIERHLELEEFYFDAAQNLEKELPRGEIEKAVKQVTDYINKHCLYHGETSSIPPNHYHLAVRLPGEESEWLHPTIKGTLKYCQEQLEALQQKLIGSGNYKGSLDGIEYKIVMLAGDDSWYDIDFTNHSTD